MQLQGGSIYIVKVGPLLIGGASNQKEIEVRSIHWRRPRIDPITGKQRSRPPPLFFASHESGNPMSLEEHADF
jgi:hypothetical protein